MSKVPIHNLLKSSGISLDNVSIDNKEELDQFNSKLDKTIADLEKKSKSEK